MWIIRMAMPSLTLVVILTFFTTATRASSVALITLTFEVSIDSLNIMNPCFHIFIFKQNISFLNSSNILLKVHNHELLFQPLTNRSTFASSPATRLVNS